MARALGLERFAALLRLLPADAVRSVLEPGCGVFESAPFLRAAFPYALLIGVDRDRYAIGAHARQSAAILIEADIRALPFRAAFDLIVIRHPDVHRSRASWEALIRSLSRWIASGGYVLVTTFTLEEHERVRAWLPDGLRVIPVERAALPAADAVARDRFVLLARVP